MQRTYTTPAGSVSQLYTDFLEQSHILIAGATGSGKSTVVNGMIHAAMFHSPATVGLVLIDPKGTELGEYKHLPHVLRYAQTTDECVSALREALELTKVRFADMKRRKMRMYDGSDVYVIIDELMYLMNRPEVKKQAMALLQDILVIARAARVHVVACTQNPTAQTIPVNLRCNFDSRLALRTATAQDSRNIIGIKGCECFPVPTFEHVAHGAYMHGGIIEKYIIPRVEDTERQRLIDWWMKHKKPRLKLFCK